MICGNAATHRRLSCEIRPSPSTCIVEGDDQFSNSVVYARPCTAMRTVPISQWGYARWALGFTVLVILLPLCVMMLDLAYMARGRHLQIPESVLASRRLAYRTAGAMAPYKRLWRQLDDCGSWQKDTFACTTMPSEAGHPNELSYLLLSQQVNCCCAGVCCNPSRGHGDQTGS